MSERTDRRIAGALSIPSIGIILYLLAKGLAGLWHGLSQVTAYNPDWWPQIGHFCVANLSVLIVIYLLICVQIAGIIELRWKRNFIKVFLMCVFLTPVGTLLFHGVKKLTGIIIHRK